MKSLNTIVVFLQEQKDDKHKARSYNDVVDKSDEKFTENGAGELSLGQLKSYASTSS